MAYHDELLLLAAESVRAKPVKGTRQATLKRAISTAYYALFHLLCHEAGLRLRLRGAARACRPLFYRAPTHTGARRVLGWFSSSGLPQGVAEVFPAAEIPPELKEVAKTFEYLLRERHRADYDPTYRCTKAEASDYVASAEGAFVAWRSVRETPAADLLATLLLFGEVPVANRTGLGRAGSA